MVDPLPHGKVLSNLVGMKMSVSLFQGFGSVIWQWNKDKTKGSECMSLHLCYHVHSVGSKTGERDGPGHPGRLGEEDGVLVTDWETLQGFVDRSL